jgi:hypothetical protein
MRWSRLGTSPLKKVQETLTIALSLAVVVAVVRLPCQHLGVFRFKAVVAVAVTANGQMSLFQ